MDYTGPMQRNAVSDAIVVCNNNFQYIVFEITLQHLLAVSACPYSFIVQINCEF